VTTWRIRVLYRDRDDSLIDVIDAARHFTDPDERATIREIGMRAHLSGMHTAGELIDALAEMSGDGRRQILDDARERAGLESIADAEARDRRNSGPTAGPPIVQCATCGVFPTDAMGAIVPVYAKKWFCPEHEDEAEPGDMRPKDAGWIDAKFRWHPPEAEVQRQRAKDERERMAREQAAEGRLAQGEERAAERRARQEQFDAEARRSLGLEAT
jgi:hypothetical protein